MAKNARKPKRMWLWREKWNENDAANDYVVTVGKKARVTRTVWSGPRGQAERSIEMCPEYYEAATPASLHLPPGGGPKEIKIVEVRKK